MNLKETLQQQASIIQSEVRLGGNTADRIGSMFLKIIDAILEKEELADEFLSKTSADQTEYLINFLGGILIGDKAAIDKQGNAQLQSLEVRGNLSVTELLINRLTAVESDYAFTGAGTVIKVEGTINGYRLFFKKRYEADFVSFQKGDILRGVINDLKNGNIHETFVRVELVDTTKNAVNVVMYPDDEVPGGKNYPPVELMVAQHRGNPINVKRQSCWYLSSQEGRIVFLDGVTKPILEDINYSSFWGKPPRLKALENQPINYDQPYFYSRGTILQDVIRIDYDGVPVKEQQDLGLWYEGLKAVNGDASPYFQSNVWHNSCKWRCVKDTTGEPTIYNTDWVLLTGDTELTLTLLSSCNFTYQKDNINDNIRAVVKMGLVDVTPRIKPQDWSWTRSTSNKLSDEIWNENNKYIQSEFKLRAIDLDGVDFSYPVMFTCTAYYRTDNKIIKTFSTLEL